MFKSLKALFEQTTEQLDANKSFNEVELAAAALLTEVAYADDDFADEEKQLLKTILRDQFHIPPELILDLIETAEKTIQDSIDHYQFTKHITSHYDYQGRCKVLAALWYMAYADKVLDAMEEHRIRHIAELLSIDHSDFIRLKIQARDQV